MKLNKASVEIVRFNPENITVLALSRHKSAKLISDDDGGENRE